MPEWDPEIEVDAALASQLIAGRFPLLSAWPLRRIGEGWDNTVWANPDGIAFRFPRRAIAVPGVEREIAMLGELAGGFLSRLHRLELPAASGLPVDPLGRADMERRVPRARAPVDGLGALWRGAERAEGVFRAALPLSLIARRSWRTAI